MLGYTPYHMIDVMYKGKKPHMKVFSEGIMAHHNRFSGIKRYETADLEKWMSEYDVSYGAGISDLSPRTLYTDA
jgi:tubulin beta